MLYTIYKLLFPGWEVYIGKTERDLKERWKYGLGYKVTSEVRQAIEKYGWENVQTFILYDGVTYEEACALETLEIKKHGGVNHPLVLNVQSGGDSEFYLSEIGKQKISKGLKRYFEEHPEAKERQSEFMKQRFIEHPELWDNVKIPVDQYSYDGTTFIATFESATEAERITGICQQHIASCLTGCRIAAGGFRWVKHGKKLGIIQYKHSNPINKVCIEQLDRETGTVIATYESVSSAAKTVGLASAAHISACINGYRKTAAGFCWKKMTAV